MKTEKIIEKVQLSIKREKIEKEIAKELGVPLNQVSAISFTIVNEITGERSFILLDDIFPIIKD